MYKKSEIMKKGSYKTGQIAKLIGIGGGYYFINPFFFWKTLWS